MLGTFSALVPLYAPSRVLGMGSGAQVVAFNSRSLTAVPAIGRLCIVDGNEENDRGSHRRTVSEEEKLTPSLRMRLHP